MLKELTIAKVIIVQNTAKTTMRLHPVQFLFWIWKALVYLDQMFSSNTEFVIEQAVN